MYLFVAYTMAAVAAWQAYRGEFPIALVAWSLSWYIVAKELDETRKVKK